MRKRFVCKKRLLIFIKPVKEKYSHNIKTLIISSMNMIVWITILLDWKYQCQAHSKNISVNPLCKSRWWIKFRRKRSSEKVSIRCFNIHLCFKMEPRTSVRYKENSYFRNSNISIFQILVSLFYPGKKVNSRFTFIWPEYFSLEYREKNILQYACVIFIRRR